MYTTKIPLIVAIKRFDTLWICIFRFYMLIFIHIFFSLPKQNGLFHLFFLVQVQSSEMDLVCLECQLLCEGWREMERIWNGWNLNASFWSIWKSFSMSIIASWERIQNGFIVKLITIINDYMLLMRNFDTFPHPHTHRFDSIRFIREKGYPQIYHRVCFFNEIQYFSHEFLIMFESSNRHSQILNIRTSINLVST